jgi:hypothetical protein
MITKQQFDEWIDDWREFNCAACGRYVIGMGMPKMEPPICGGCLSHPGWYESPFMVAVLDPHNTRWRAAVSIGVVETECRASWLDATMAWLHGSPRHFEIREEMMRIDQSNFAIDIDLDYDRPVGEPKQQWLH